MPDHREIWREEHTTGSLLCANSTPIGEGCGHGSPQNLKFWMCTYPASFTTTFTISSYHLILLLFSVSDV